MPPQPTVPAKERRNRELGKFVRVGRCGNTDHGLCCDCVQGSLLHGLDDVETLFLLKHGSRIRKKSNKTPSPVLQFVLMK